MKRCIQCDFVYEDDQRVCDMDGADLAFEPTLHPFGVDATPETAGGSGKAKWKSMAALPIALFMLGAVFFVGNQSSPSTEPHAANQPATAAPVEPSANPVVETPPAEPSPSAEVSPAAESSASPVVKASTARSRSAARAERRPAPAPTSPKRESTIGGFWKKTSRILKKPFKKL
jgi:hypothetical protein